MVTGLVVAGVCIIVAISAYLFCKWRKKVHRFKTGKYTWTIRPSIDLGTKQDEKQMGLDQSLDQSLI